MIMGIANSVADAGQSGEAFVHTIRNLTQSYSTGFLNLQDWNSLAIAKTNSKALIENLIEAGKELGTLDAQGRTSAGTLVDTGTFRNTLSEKWATKAVMEKAFNKYAQMTLDVYDLTRKKESLHPKLSMSFPGHMTTSQSDPLRLLSRQRASTKPLMRRRMRSAPPG